MDYHKTIIHAKDADFHNFPPILFFLHNRMKQNINQYIVTLAAILIKTDLAGLTRNSKMSRYRQSQCLPVTREATIRIICHFTWLGSLLFKLAIGFNHADIWALQNVPNGLSGQINKMLITTTNSLPWANFTQFSTAPMQPHLQDKQGSLMSNLLNLCYRRTTREK